MKGPSEGSPLAGQVALVTGASRGIGRATATALAACGARVGLVARDREALELLARSLDGWALPCDVTEPDELARTLHGFEEAVGRTPDLVVVSAGVFSVEPIRELTAEELHRNLAVNLEASILTVRSVLPRLLDRGRGTIVLVGSIAGRRAFPGNASYSASKFGLRGFHEVLLEELRGTGVRATLLEPAATDTSIWDPLEPDEDPDLPDRDSMLRPEAVADCIVFVAEREDRVRIPFLAVEPG
ncbi:MAG: SDR family oxidoreductase [Gemmatimonadota bacterium]